MSDDWKRTLRDGATTTANAVHSTTQLVARQAKPFGKGTEEALKFTAGALDTTGRTVAAGSKAVANAAHEFAGAAGQAVMDAVTGDSRNQVRVMAGVFAGGTAWLGTKLVAWAGDGAAAAGDAVAAVARWAGDGAPAVGGAVGGAVKGAAEITGHLTDAALLTSDSIDELRDELRRHGVSLQERSAETLRQRQRQRDALIDRLVVGGMTLSQVIAHPEKVPQDVERAFELAYPGLHASGERFADVVERLPADNLTGLVSGVKGKLFELQLVDQLNSGQLPDGWQAEMATSVTQPGWDIRIVDETGQVQEILQAKATESVSYVQEALERYPDIDVTTTSEVHAQMVALGLAESVNNSGISEASLESVATEATKASDATLDATDLLPSTIGLGVIALSVFLRSDLDLREKGAALGERGAQVGVTSWVGKAAMVATQTWWLGLLAGVGSHWLAGHGSSRREEYNALRSAAAALKRQKSLAETRQLGRA